jgi:fatty-acyl-CoA synthase
LSSSHLCSYLEFNASRFPERHAALDPDGTALKYREFNDRADRVAGFLMEQGVIPGDRVGVVLPRPPWR